MQPQHYDIATFEQGSLSLSATVYTDDTTLQNLTGYTASMRIMDKQNGTVIATLTHSSGITLGGAAGTIVVNQTPAQVQAWKLDRGAYDLTITSGSGAAEVLLFGSLEVVKT